MSASQIRKSAARVAGLLCQGSEAHYRPSLETPMALAQRAGEQLITLGKIEPIDTVVERIEAVSADDILRVARRVLVPENAVLSVVGPELEEEVLLGLLAEG